jgi:predicted acylesterase/phospholipase RssA
MALRTNTILDPAHTAVILGSSFLGVYAHAGFMSALDSLGFSPARIAGSSGGALAGAFHACGLRGEALRDTALDPKLRRSFFDLGCFFLSCGRIESAGSCVKRWRGRRIS